MQLKPQNERILFGLKLRQLRQQKKLSFQQLSKQTGISVSYLNEIEKGKKSPKSEKLQDLSLALEVDPKTFVELKFDNNMRPVAELLRSNFLNELPLDRFGIELNKVVEIIASAPARVGAFISTLLELSRNYALIDENFYLGALRAWLEMHSNYLEESEQYAVALREQQAWAVDAIPTTEQLASILEQQFDYHIEYDGIEQYTAFEDLDRVYIPESNLLLLSGQMQERDKRYHLAMEIGYQGLNIRRRNLVDPFLRVRTFEEVLDRARAHHVAAALLLPPEQFNFELQRFFGDTEPALDVFQKLLEKYQVTPDLLLDRVATLLSHFRDIHDLFVIKLEETKEKHLQIVRELHLGKQHRPHSTGLIEHYCRRWIGSKLLLRYRNRVRIGVQISKYYGSDDEYFVLAIAERSYRGQRQATFIGMPFTPELERAIPALLKTDLGSQTVNNTCERCAVKNCKERAAVPTFEEARTRRKNVKQTIEELQRQARQNIRRNSKRI